MDLMQRRGLIGQKGSVARLPEAYREVEYIEGVVNAQYINTGIAGNKDSLIIEAKVKPGAYAQYIPLWGNYVDEQHKVTRLIAYGNTGVLAPINVLAGSGVDSNYVMLFGTGNVFVIRQERTKLIVNGNTYTTSIRNAGGTENDTFIAMNAARVNSANIGSAIHRFYYFRILDGDDVLIDLVPCYRKADGEVGMFDLVSQAFFANAGTGDFTRGRAV